MGPAHGRGISITKLHANVAAKKLHEKDNGLHMMVIYSDLDILRRFYCTYTKKEIKRYDSMIVIAPFYETTDSVRHYLSKPSHEFDVVKYEDDRMLTIVDAAKLSTNEEITEFTTDMTKIFKSLGKANITIIGDSGGIFCKSDQPKCITMYEGSFSNGNKNSNKHFCLYNEKDIDTLSAYQLLELLEIHDMIIELVD